LSTHWKPRPTDPPRLLDQVRAVLRRKHSALRTQAASLGWITRFSRFHHLRHPRALGWPAVDALRTDLAVAQQLAASTQNQALSALLFLSTEGLGQPRDGPIQAVRAKHLQRLPTVRTRAEVTRVRDALTGVQLMAKLRSGSGLRLMACVRLRVKDVAFGQRQSVVRAGTGGTDRVTTLPERLIVPLQEQLRRAELLHAPYLRAG